ncbi:enoyl-CoA hydratase/isomerase family protein [Pseudoxanthomonas sp. LH2527]|uniref:enoyl-CoA hydratase/isomerase family protein n=1 Tax=Pseudoxanthomonas sp. LH2527 TaxID=2923249 RepID=UPI001F14103A|nr:enoyl-CoA hydratase/isomerase family protein [Pseudoxanthomonas sp. LH2527]MCH6485226.1 enoyl-CoA hydratase/isomerase family protein [Pseudoxanthomonas sp. LH2527]
MTGLIDTIDHGDIREIRLARPPVNALNTELCRALIDALNTALDQGVRGIVLAGNPKIFSAGMDVPYLLSLGDDRHALLDAWQAFFGAARSLAESRVPVVAAITGHAPAGGCVLALCCDYRVMARSPDPARPFALGLNETQVGLVVPEGIQRLMRRVVGAYRAERLLVAGEMVPAERALEIGLVDELVDQTDVTARAVAWLQQLLRLPHTPMLQTRTLARRDLVEALEPALIQLERFVDAWHAPDTQVALRALVDKLRK